MPFDSTTFRQRRPSVTALPPTPPEPPERDGRPLRVRVEIEIVDRRPLAPKGAGYRFGSITMTLLMIILLAILLGCAQAHADNGGPRYEHWQDTNGWHGETRQQGSTTDWTAYGPRGEQRHCHRYYVGDQPYTSCN